jgi:hypothetical protein
MVNANTLRRLWPPHGISIGYARQNTDYMLEPMQHRRDETQTANAAAAAGMYRLQS